MIALTVPSLKLQVCKTTFASFKLTKEIHNNQIQYRIHTFERFFHCSNLFIKSPKYRI